MAAPKNKKRRSRKRNRAASGGGPAKGAAPPPTGGAAAERHRQAKVSKAKRAQKANETRKSAPGPPSVKADRSEAPKPIWAPLPITEGLILVGLVVAILGLVQQSVGLAITGFALIVISSLELAVREHLAGYRSHTTMISGIVGLAIAALLKLLLDTADVGIPQWPLLFIAVFVFAGMFRVLRQQFKERSGGLTYRV